MKSSKHTISIDYKNNYNLVGISTIAKPHRICSVINRTLNIKLSRVQLLEEFQLDYPEGFPFIAYRYHNQNMWFKIILIKNLNDEGYFLKECRQADYLLFLKTHVDLSANTDIVEELKKADIIQLAYNIDMSKLKAAKKIRIE